ncbi:hypothetical protein V5N11_034728 [Cardamine amara subsp. amara]|uniref:DUF676 domain-containing protein n=1 Tax=Cardamine amara subsp. amara TaxID=228776 RepID=A0ABD1BE64_CARAN
MEKEDSEIPRKTEGDERVGRDFQGIGRSKMKMKTRRSGKSWDKETKTTTKKKYWMGCLRAESDESGNVDLTVDFPGELTEPTHLVVMVNGLIGSSQDWRFAAKQMLKKYPQDLVVHCSKRNHSTQTFVGVDVMGERLAEEVRSVIKRHPSLQKISFVGHSLVKDIGDNCPIEEPKERIAGLEPVYFITSASPHLGSRGHKQVPLFSGSHALERLARRMSWCLGKTGKHLFLADSDGGKRDDGKHLLLIRMVYDSRDLKFISALRCFKRRIAYANTSFDHLVGWSTSSIRHHNELPKLQRAPVSEKYPHIVNVEAAVTTSNRKEDRSGTNSNGFKNLDKEEEMIRELTKLSWERVDVSFRGTLQRFLAHNTIQVKTKMINSAGADVIQHMVDNFEP